MSYKITLITPVYNAARTLAQTAESVRAQTLGFENIQYILSDDRSTDGSYELCAGLAERYDNVAALRAESNSGSDGPPRNAALPLAEAPYLMFLDADDVLAPDACETLYGFIEASGADIASGDAAELHETPGEPDGYIAQYKELPRGVYDLGEPSRETALSLCHNMWSKIYRRSTAERCGARFGDGRGWADLLFLYCFLSASKSAGLVRKNVISYRVSAGSMSHAGGADIKADIPKSICAGLAWADARSLSGRFERLLSLMRVPDYYAGALLRFDGDEGERTAALRAWTGFFTQARGRGLYMDTAWAKILSRDLCCGDTGKALFDLGALRELNAQRERELEDIFSSRGWRLASAAQRALGLFSSKRDEHGI